MPIQPYFCRRMFTWFFFFNRRDEHKLLLIQEYFHLIANSLLSVESVTRTYQALHSVHFFQILELTYNKYVKELAIS